VTREMTTRAVTQTSDLTIYPVSFELWIDDRVLDER
jgi:hypothetical protein